jgi:lysophospholipase L1-like esterase
VADYLKRSEGKKIIFLGDSLVERGDWERLMERNDLANWGIGGDTVAGAARRASALGRFHPDLCLIMVGTNDLPTTPYEKLTTDYRSLLDTVITLGVKPVIHAIPYVTAEYEARFPGKNAAIARFNAFLGRLAGEKKIPIVNLDSELSKDGSLVPIYSIDGLHLSEEGYARWTAELKPVLRNG